MFDHDFKSFFFKGCCTKKWYVDCYTRIFTECKTSYDYYYYLLREILYFLGEI